MLSLKSTKSKNKKSEKVKSDKELAFPFLGERRGEFVVDRSTLRKARLGLFYRPIIPPRTILIEYTGERLTQEQVDARYPPNGVQVAEYLVPISDNPKLYIDAVDPSKSSIARFANDALNKDKNNAQLYYDDTKDKEYVVSTKWITPGEEIFVEYGAAYWDDYKTHNDRLKASAVVIQSSQEDEPDLLPPTINPHTSTSSSSSALPRVEVRPSDIDPTGRGLFALESIPPKTRIVQYTGEVLDSAQYKARYPNERDAQYVIQVTENYYIDARDESKSSVARFVNDRRNAIKNNATFVIDKVRKTCWLKSKENKRIQPGEEITASYRGTYWRGVPENYVRHVHDDSETETETETDEGMDVIVVDDSDADNLDVDDSAVAAVPYVRELDLDLTQDAEQEEDKPVTTSSHQMRLLCAALQRICMRK